MGIATEGWFRGCWRIARLVTGSFGQATAAFAGTCRFAPDGAGLVCEETGILRHGGERFPATRATLWRFPGAGRIDVRFADGRLFHAFNVDRPEGEHLCGRDRYRVRYDFDTDRFFSRWEVQGPQKDYWMTTRYLRIADVMNGIRA